MWADPRVDQFLRRRTRPEFARVDAWERRLLARWLGPHRGGTLLDIGCGDGRLFDLWQSHVDRVVGVDGNLRQCVAARERATRLEMACEVRHRDARSAAMPLADLAVCVRLWAHIDQASADDLLLRLMESCPRVILQFSERNGSSESAAIEAGGEHRLDALPRICRRLHCGGYSVDEVRRMTASSTTTFVLCGRSSHREDPS